MSCCNNIIVEFRIIVHIRRDYTKCIWGQNNGSDVQEVPLFCGNETIQKACTALGLSCGTRNHVTIDSNRDSISSSLRILQVQTATPPLLPQVKTLIFCTEVLACKKKSRSQGRWLTSNATWLRMWSIKHSAKRPTLVRASESLRPRHTFSVKDLTP